MTEQEKPLPLYTDRFIRELDIRFQEFLAGKMTEAEFLEEAKVNFVHQVFEILHYLDFHDCCSESDEGHEEVVLDNFSWMHEEYRVAMFALHEKATKERTARRVADEKRQIEEIKKSMAGKKEEFDYRKWYKLWMRKEPDETVSPYAFHDTEWEYYRQSNINTIEDFVELMEETAN